MKKLSNYQKTFFNFIILNLLFTHGNSFTFVRLSIPGILLPCINYKLAPPPVDIKDTPFESPN